MKFFISEPSLLMIEQTKKPYAVLRKDNWNDYSYRTRFTLYVYVPNSPEGVLIGKIKIMYFGQKPEESTFNDEIEGFIKLSSLEKYYCSLGEDLEFYATLKELGDEIGVLILESLCDVSYNSNIRSKFEKEHCFNTSLLRYNESKEALDKGASLFGKSIIRQIEFKADIPVTEDKFYNLNFNFESYRGLPHRVNLLVGSNGVGKTQVMAKLAILLSRFAKDENDNNKSSFNRLFEAGNIEPRPSLYNVVAISFNAFDSFELPTVKQTSDFSYSYCGLRKTDTSYYNEEELSEKINSLLTGLVPDKKAIADNFLSQLLHYGEDNDLTNTDKYTYLSAGQKIVVNILLHILNKIKPQSLLLLDEPETHLHPKLMTTLYLILVDLLEEFDSFAVIATHSPIIVQQVPSRSIQILKRIENQPVMVTPIIECFGENLSEISRNVFQTADSDRDYEAVIDKLLEDSWNDVNEVEDIFDGNLGMNARIYLHSKAKN